MKTLLYFVITALSAQVTWRDPSPHERRFVTVDTSITLEVLDWGGSGRPVLFVGCYLTAHVYDNIAPKLRDRFHVYAVTRRGVGASDHPATGYDPQRRADDVLEVIAGLKMQQPILVGNSCGGDILHTLGARNPESIGGLMYLDAAEDPTLTPADYEQMTIDTTHLPARVNRPRTVEFPEAETRQMQEWPLDPALRRAIVEDNRVKPDYARIRVPVVAIYRTMSFEQVLEEYPPKTDEERAAVKKAYDAAARSMLSKWEHDLLAGVPNAKIVELPGASLYMFLSNEAEIIRELRAFASSLDTAPKLSPAMVLHVKVGAPMEVGTVPRGRRRIIPIEGGTFEGPTLRGTVLAGGADWQIVRADSVSELDTRYALKTDAGELIYIQNAGGRHAPPDITKKLLAGEDVDPSLVYFRTVPTFETAAPHLQWLTRSIFVGTGERHPNEVVIRVWKVE
jgi:pimeloyl-ACP methyl ester carboxylesterase